MSLGWFVYIEPSLSTSLQGKQGAYALVLGSSSTSNLLEPHHCRDRKVCRVTFSCLFVIINLILEVYEKAEVCVWTDCI